MTPLEVSFGRTLMYFQRRNRASAFHQNATFKLYRIERVHDLDDSYKTDESGHEHILHPYKLYDMPYGAMRHEYYLSNDEYNAIQRYLADSNVSSITINLAHVRTN